MLGITGTMLITRHVDIPDEVLEAHASGNLVLFVGAGVSWNSPSDLPLFESLARLLAEEAAVPVTKKPLTEIDRFIGDLPPDFNAHRFVKRLISAPSSRPNEVHRALLELASTGPAIRIVTTNFDDHLARAAADMGISVPDRWDGPALPLGGDFEGIVHLHGSIRREESQLVLNDRDFGRAYLANGWATRFLLPLFARYTVLFIGYSHEDPIMRYLGLGLPPETSRYVLIAADEAKALKWERLRVTPISYPADNGHAALPETFSKWSQWQRMGFTDHRAKMKRAVRVGVSLPEIDYVYIKNRLGSRNGIQDFVSVMRGQDETSKLDWLLWLEAEHEPFTRMFSDAYSWPGSELFASWFCTEFVASPSLNGAALQTIQRQGQRFSTELFQRALSVMGDLSQADSQAGRRWMALLTTSIAGQSRSIDPETLIPYQDGSNVADAVYVRSLVAPIIQLQERWSLPGESNYLACPTAYVEWQVGFHELSSVLSSIEIDGIPAARAMSTILTGAVEAAFDLHDAFNGSDETTFGSYRWMSAGHESSLDAILQAMRSIGISIMSADSTYPFRLWDRERHAFRALALGLMSLETCPLDNTVETLIDSGSLLRGEYFREIRTLLNMRLPNAPKTVVKRLIGYLQDEAKSSVEGTSEADLIQLWLKACNNAAEGGQGTPEALTSFENQFLNEGLKWGGESSQYEDSVVALSEYWHDVESLKRQVLVGVHEVIEELKLVKDESLGSERPRIYRCLSQMSDAVKEDSDIGVLLWVESNVIKADENLANSIRESVLRGWGDSKLGESASSVLRLIADYLDASRSFEKVSSFLVSQVQLNHDTRPADEWKALRILAVRLWEQGSPSFTRRHSQDQIPADSEVINSWPGQLAFFWMVEIELSRKRAGSDWRGLSDVHAGALVNLIDATGDARKMTHQMIGRFLFSLYQADATFVQIYLIPVFEDLEQLPNLWLGYLQGPTGFNSALLADGLLKFVIAQWEQLSILSDSHLLEQFFGLNAAILTCSGISVTARASLLNASVVQSNGKYAAVFARAVAMFTLEASLDGAQIWEDWLHLHIRNRIDERLRNLRQDELSNWADIVPHLGRAIPSALDAFGSLTIPFKNTLGIKNQLEGVSPAEAKLLVPFFTQRLNDSNEWNRFMDHRMNALAGRLTGLVGEAAARPFSDAISSRRARLDDD